MSTIPEEILHQLCPMHAVLDRDGRIRQAGPTLHKLGTKPLEGADFLEVFEVVRPRAVTSMTGLLGAQGRKLHMKLRHGKRTPLKGVVTATCDCGAVVNLSFGIAVVDAVRDYALTGSDFAPTDLAVEMLYLLEAKSAAMDASRSLNTRLQGAMVAAEERAFTDTLTGLGNRRALDSVLEHVGRTRRSFALMHIDLDFFKQVNDTLGHAAGDSVLRHVARIMRDVTRKGDTVARVGGDEFVIVFGDMMRHDRLSRIAQTLIDRIAQPTAYGDKHCQVAASIGIAFSDQNRADPAAVLANADAALYASKRSGRGRFTFHDPRLAKDTGDDAVREA